MNMNYTTLNAEARRLASVFIPEYDVGGIEVIVRRLQPNCAALAYHCNRKIHMACNYKWDGEREWKMTLLHELGHIVYDPDPNHGSRFREYYELLKARQGIIDEKLIPDSYHAFIYTARECDG